MPVLLDSPLDQLVEFVRAKGEGVAEFPIAGIRPGKLDAALVAAVQPAFEQVADVTAHLCRIGLEHGLDVAHRHWGMLP